MILSKLHFRVVHSPLQLNFQCHLVVKYCMGPSPNSSYTSRGFQGLRYYCNLNSFKKVGNSSNSQLMSIARVQPISVLQFHPGYFTTGYGPSPRSLVTMAKDVSRTTTRNKDTEARRLGTTSPNPKNPTDDSKSRSGLGLGKERGVELAPKTNSEPGSSSTTTPSITPPQQETPLSTSSKLKQAVKDYGATVIVFHVSMSLVSLGFFYLLVTRYT